MSCGRGLAGSVLCWQNRVTQHPGRWCKGNTNEKSFPVCCAGGRDTVSPAPAVPTISPRGVQFCSQLSGHGPWPDGKAPHGSQAPQSHGGMALVVDSLAGQESGRTLRNSQRWAVSDLQTQQLLSSLVLFLFYFTQQPDHEIPLPESAPLPPPSRIKPRLLTFIQDLACLPFPTPCSVTAHSVPPAGLPSVPATHPRTFVLAPRIPWLAPPCHPSTNSQFIPQRGGSGPYI